MPAAHLRTPVQNAERARRYTWVAIVLCVLTIGLVFLSLKTQGMGLVIGGLTQILAVIFSICAVAVSAELKPPRPKAPLAVGAWVLMDLNRHGVY
jgi:hypothetical protein